MAFFRTLIKTLTRNPKPKSLHHPHSLLPSPNPFSLFPLPLSGSLFHSPTPWNLSHFSTPFHLRGKDVIFPKDLVQVRRSLPFELGFRGEVEDGVLRRRSGSGSGSEEKVVVGGESGDGFLNLPNLVSIGRGVSGPFIGWMIVNEWYLPAFCGLAISGATDWLDGFLARKMGINSVFGSYLDPLADKVLIGCVALAMVKQDLLHPALVGLVVFRECALVAGAVYKRASSLGWEWNSWSEFANLDATHREKVEPLFISKVNTVFQLLLVAGALLQPELGTEETQLYIDYLSWLVASTTVASSAAYGVQHLRYRAAFTPAKR